MIHMYVCIPKRDTPSEEDQAKDPRQHLFNPKDKKYFYRAEEDQAK